MFVHAQLYDDHSSYNCMCFSVNISVPQTHSQILQWVMQHADATKNMSMPNWWERDRKNQTNIGAWYFYHKTSVHLNIENNEITD